MTAIQLFDVNTTYDGENLYHAGLVYRTAERVLVLPTKWISTLPSPSTGLLYAKKIRAFLNDLEASLADDLKVEVITNFERFVTRHHIHRWMANRVAKRIAAGAQSPSDATIEDDAHVVSRYLSWVKTEYEEAGRGTEIPFEKAKKIQTVRKLRDNDMLKGIVPDVSVEGTERVFRLAYKPDPGTPVDIMARRTQTMGHEYLRDDEISVFVNAFSDKVWKFVALASYHTGMRPSEVLAIPRHVEYGRGQFFTSEPAQIRRLIASGKDVQELVCLGKGMKKRRVKFVLREWLAIMEAYEPLYQERHRLFQATNGEPLPLHCLWLNKLGEVRYCQPGDGLARERATKPLHRAVATARDSHDLENRFGHAVDFYSLRHSFATNYIVNMLRAHEDLREKGNKDIRSLIEDDSLRKMLSDQMGHSLGDTTWRHYIHASVARSCVVLPCVTDILKA